MFWWTKINQMLYTFNTNINKDYFKINYTLS